ncbi:serine/threonine protein kinase [Hyalangium versicolor]|uniref:serine/threonine protein kinase n=1 Tax=Hyalangium versicolor TaxID=2861190 RepID=UPI001CCF4412|nr:serine/threonine-protein kinase [Hyalangium versicolor]
MRLPPLPKVAPGLELLGCTVEGLVDMGGFGAVYRARDPAGMLYALKFMALARAGGWAQREQEILLRLRHSNIVRLWGSCLWPEESSEFLVLKLEFIPGQALDHWAHEWNPDAREVAGKVLGVARALAVAHAEGVVHRDVKEANILVREADGEAVLIDFGAGYFARAPTVTVAVLPPGTPDYRAPEAWRFAEEHEADPRAHYRPGPLDDVYALGVVLYGLLTGQRPFYLDREEDGVAAILHTPPVPPHVRNPRVPVELSQLCLRLLAKRPEERVAGAVVLCQELTEQLAAADARWAVRLQEVGRFMMGRNLPRAPPPPPEPNPGVGEPAAPLALAPSSSGAGAAVPLRPVAFHALGRAALWAGALGVVVCLCLFLLSRRERVPREPEAQPVDAHQVKPGTGQEVAPAGQEPEASRAAAPSEPEPTSAAAAPLAVPPEDASAMKTRDTPAMPSRQKPRSPGLGPVGKKVATGAVCATLGCTPAAAPQLRPNAPEECPRGALEAMAGLNIHVGDVHFALLNPAQGLDRVFVKEGEATLRLVNGPFEGIPAGSTLKGRLLIGAERVYGRFTLAQEYKGPRTWPVCLELLGGDDERGMPIEVSTDDEARVVNSASVRVVDRFK